MCNSKCAIECFNNGYSCSQAVFSTYCSELGLEKELGLKIAGAFGGGMGHIGETCGAVTGAFLLIGLKYGKVQQDDNQSKLKTYSMVQEFAKRFKQINGSVRCKELLGYDVGIPEEMEIVKSKELFTSICPKLVKDACNIIEEIL